MNISSYIITKSSSHLTLAIAKSLPRLAHKYYLSKNNKFSENRSVHCILTAKPFLDSFINGFMKETHQGMLDPHFP